MKNEAIIATITATIPVQSAITALGKDFAHNLKSELNSMSGMASGTDICISKSRMPFKDFVSSVVKKLENEKRNDNKIPTVNAIITVPIFFATLNFRKSVMTIKGVRMIMEMIRAIFIS